MQTPTTTMRAPRGADAMIWSITPGTPTHSKTTAGRSGGPGTTAAAAARRPVAPHGDLVPALVGRALRRDRRRRPRPARRRAAGAAARSRRRRSGRTSRSRSAAMTARPTGPQPITSGTSSGSSRAFSTACSADRHRLGERGVLGREAVRHLEQQHLASAACTRRSRPAIVVRVADALEARSGAGASGHASRRACRA